MTIRKRQSWGRPGCLGSAGVVVHSDSEGSAAIAAARAAGAPMPDLGLVGGDLCATLGGTGSEEHLRGSDARRFPVDLGIATADGVEYVFIAHVLVRRRAWIGRVLAAMNAQYRGAWDLGPKSHPNDGLLDISDARLGLADKAAAHRRLRSGTHVPHPHIAVRRTSDATFDFDPPGLLEIDGTRVGRVRHLDLTVEPDAFFVVV